MRSAVLAFVAAGTVVAIAQAVALAQTRRRHHRVVRRLGRDATPDRPVPAAIARTLDRAGLDAHRRLLDRWLVVSGGAILAALTSVPGGVVLAVVALVGPPVAVVIRRDHRRNAEADALPVALDTMAAALRGGMSLTNAIGSAGAAPGPLAADFGWMHDHATRGRSVVDVVDEWSDGADPAPDRALAGAAIALSARVGGAGSLALDSAASSLRDRRAADAEVDALSVQARLSAWLLTLTPIGFAFLLTTLDPSSARFLLATPLGWACIAGGVALDALGTVWMRRIVRSAR